MCGRSRWNGRCAPGGRLNNSVIVLTLVRVTRVRAGLKNRQMQRVSFPATVGVFVCVLRQSPSENIGASQSEWRVIAYGDHEHSAIWRVYCVIPAYYIPT